MMSLVFNFSWMDKLGVSAAMDVKVVMRQTLYGGNYALLDANMDPNPVKYNYQMKQFISICVILYIHLKPKYFHENV